MGENGQLVVSRPDGKLTDRQYRFVHLLVEGRSRREAYREAGYQADASDDQVDSAVSNLLGNRKVYAYYRELQAEMASQSVMTGVRWANELRLIAMEAAQEHDWAGAVSALREIGKHLGYYAVDNRQRSFGPEETQRILDELAARGIEYPPPRVNAPAHLKTRAPQPPGTGKEGTNGQHTS